VAIRSVRYNPRAGVTGGENVGKRVLSGIGTKWTEVK
jgi:hypothetical protein